MALVDLGQTDLTLADLQTLQNQLRQQGKLLFEVWCVDRPDMLPRLRALCQPWLVADTTGVFGGQLGAMLGVRLVEIANRLKEPLRDKLNRPVFSLIPGVWLRYSDGSLERMQSDADEPFSQYLDRLGDLLWTGRDGERGRVPAAAVPGVCGAGGPE